MAARLTAYLVAFIVSATFIAGLIVGAQRDDSGPVDLIVVNGNVYTADGDNTMAEAVAVQGNKILLVGSNREVQRLRRPQTLVVDAQGGAVLPGFNDQQVDFIETGLALRQVDLEGADTLPAIESAIRMWAAMNPAREWVIGAGWNDAAFEDRSPSRQLLDTLVPDRPAMLLAEDGETAWVNSAALKLANITRRTTSPPDGAVVKDARTGEPTGLLKGEAVEMVAKLIPAPDRDERLAALRAAIEHAHRRGVTSVQDLNTSPSDLDLYDTLRRDNELDVRVYAALGGHADLTDAELDAFDELRKRYPDDPVLKAGAISLVADSDGADGLRELVTELDERGWQVIIRAIGEGAVRVARDAVEYASGKSAAPEGSRRHRVEAEPDEFEEPVESVQLAVSENRTVLQAIDAHTREAAWASFDEHRKGSLERDMLADMVILTHDVFADPPARAATTGVAVTIFDGKVVYTRPSHSND
jgi:predicted amidohydrolase YtcJ